MRLRSSAPREASLALTIWRRPASGEGVAKEFLVDVLKAGFDPAFGLFSATPDGTLYPNPAAPLRIPESIGSTSSSERSSRRRCMRASASSCHWRHSSSQGYWAARTRSRSAVHG